MRKILWLALLLAAPAAFAQTDPAPRPDEAAQRADVPLPEKIQPPPGDELPTVSIRSMDNGDRVEEYRQAGRIYMVRVVPPRGLPYVMMDANGDGKLDRKDSEAPVAPVYFTIYEWD